MCLQELSDLKSEHEALMNDLSVRESNIKEIEKEQSLKNLAWNNEKASLETKVSFHFIKLFAFTVVKVLFFYNDFILYNDISK